VACPNRAGEVYGQSYRGNITLHGFSQAKWARRLRYRCAARRKAGGATICRCRKHSLFPLANCLKCQSDPALKELACLPEGSQFLMNPLFDDIGILCAYVLGNNELSGAVMLRRDSLCSLVWIPSCKTNFHNAGHGRVGEYIYDALFYQRVTHLNGGCFRHRLLQIERKSWCSHGLGPL
jgi:hypothetical protein